MLARTDPQRRDYKGLSISVGAKSAGTTAALFAATGMRGAKRGGQRHRTVKDYEISFDGFAMGAETWLYAQECRRFTQLMATFESTPIQAAAHAAGKAQSASNSANR